MEEFIYGERNGIHIMDLTQTVPMLDAALNVAREKPLPKVEEFFSLEQNDKPLQLLLKQQKSVPSTT